MKAREIKFRAVIDGMVFGFNLEYMSYPKDDSIRESIAKFLQDGNIPDQYTGLKDKNGVEIYEGDIVEISDRCDGDRMMIGEVKFGVRGYPAFDVYDKSNVTYSDEYNSLTNDDDLSFEIIGNIHQHPHLLEQTA